MEGIEGHHRKVTGDDLNIRPTAAEDVPEIEYVLGRDQARFYSSRLGRPGTVLGAWLKGELTAALYVSWESADEPEVKLRLPDVPLLYRLHVREDLRRRRIGTTL